jgi:hypothetical protein
MPALSLSLLCQHPMWQFCYISIAHKKWVDVIFVNIFPHNKFHENSAEFRGHMCFVLHLQMLTYSKNNAIIINVFLWS